jgi:hypothetical protein
MLPSQDAVAVAHGDVAYRLSTLVTQLLNGPLSHAQVAASCPLVGVPFWKAPPLLRDFWYDTCSPQLRPVLHDSRCHRFNVHRVVQVSQGCMC